MELRVQKQKEIEERKIYQKKFTVTYPDIDPFGQITLSRLLDYCTVVSYEQSEQVGIGAKFLRTIGTNWIINEVEMNFICFPRYGEEFTIDVYATSFNKFFIYRQFDIYNSQKEKIGSIFMSLSLLDLEKRSIFPLKDEVGDAFGAKKEKRIYRFEKIYPEESEYSEHKVTAQNSHLDYNRHVYNGIYYQWMFDSLPIEFLETHQLTYFLMRFEAEIALGEQVTIQSNLAETQGETTWRLSGSRDEKAIAKARWRE
ncbi:MAG: acyl-[acyl-carrier-protein] thioesterase [Enterococcus sp.]